jgi:hypothetical protein
MDLIDQLRTIADRSTEEADRLGTDEATKNRLILQKGRAPTRDLYHRLAAKGTKCRRRSSGRAWVRAGLA